jgi:hypothetical protein
MELIKSEQKNEKKMDKSIIIYGPENSGKYTKAIEIIKSYSKYDLKYKRKIEVEVNSELYYFNISDIHFEIDFELLGTNENSLWSEFISKVTDIIESQLEFGIILCRNFHFIDNDLLKIFLTFMRNKKMRFILCTKHISYIPKEIKENCSIIALKKIYSESYGNQYTTFCDNIINFIYDNDNGLFQLRELLYQLSTYNYDIHQCLQYIYFKVMKLYPDLVINKSVIIDIMERYNTKYRTIFHLELFIITIKTELIRQSLI